MFPSNYGNRHQWKAQYWNMMYWILSSCKTAISLIVRFFSLDVVPISFDILLKKNLLSTKIVLYSLQCSDDSKHTTNPSFPLNPFFYFERHTHLHDIRFLPLYCWNLENNADSTELFKQSHERPNKQFISFCQWFIHRFSTVSPSAQHVVM